MGCFLKILLQDHNLSIIYCMQVSVLQGSQDVLKKQLQAVRADLVAARTQQLESAQTAQHFAQQVSKWLATIDSFEGMLNDSLLDNTTCVGKDLL